MQVSEQWMLTLDGKTIQRGLSRRQAERLASEQQTLMDTKISGTRRRTGGFEIQRDVGAIQQHDALYKSSKRSTFIVRP